MRIKVRQSWELPESAASPEEVYLNRRALLKAATGAAIAAPLAGLAGPAFAEENKMPMTAPVDPDYTAALAGRPITPEQTNITYNNFYEFGSHKQIFRAAEHELKPHPWQITIDGEVDKPITLDVDDLIKKMGLEERVYRHRCVEAWSMVVPWVGFPVKKLVDFAQPNANAKYLRMETFGNPSMASGIRSQPWYPWPYIEGITMAEATNDLALLVVGAYGKTVPNSMGAPIRLHLPWKYGFKSIKSIIKFTFTAERPVGFWEEISRQSHNDEYGFWANVNPEVPHPRWSQASERVLGSGERIPTELYNGYAEQVASIYSDIKGQQLFR